MSVNIIVLSIIIIIAVLFLIIFIPLFTVRNEVSQNIRDKIYPKFIELNKTIITLTSGTIALTVSFIDRQSGNKEYVIFAWILLGVCIIMSILILLLQYLAEYTINIAQAIKKRIQNIEVSAIEEKKRKKKLLTWSLKQHIVI